MAIDTLGPDQEQMASDSEKRVAQMLVNSLDDDPEIVSPGAVQAPVAHPNVERELEKIAVNYELRGIALHGDEGKTCDSKAAAIRNLLDAAKAARPQTEA